MRSGYIVPVTLVAAFAALPSPLTDVIIVGPISVHLYEVCLVLSALWALSKPRQGHLLLYVAPFVAVTGLVLVASLLGGAASPTRALADVRHLALMVLAIFVSSRVVGTPLMDVCLRTIKWVLWFSALMVILSSATGLKLAGRSEVATLDYGSSVGAVRLLTPATYPAVVVIAICAALLIGGEFRVKKLLPWLLPAVVVVVLAFSRNHLIGFGIAILFALVAFRSSKSFIAAMRVSTVFLASLFALTFILSTILSGLPGSAFVNEQINSYATRVVEGLRSDVIERDTSSSFREEENYFMEKEIAESPVLGNGYGFAYKPATGPIGSFTRDYAPYYAHNFYLWLTVKAGVIGLVAFLWMVLVPLLRTLISRPSYTGIALGSALAGLMGINFVAPIPNGTPTSFLFGLLLGGVIATLPARTLRHAENAQTRGENSPQTVTKTGPFD